MMGTWMPETKEINKYIKQNCAPSWTYLRDYTMMYGQQNIKKKSMICTFYDIIYSEILGCCFEELIEEE